ncbi:TPA: hypothetical protein RZH60_001760, partial [Campylobacter coli]|nr:hypothetical protein [Campylobacter coli]
MILAVDIIQEYREKIRNKIQKEKLDEKLYKDIIKRIYLKKYRYSLKANEILKRKSMKTYNILLEKWMDFHKNQCKEFIH